ncbi:hypothetical protein [Thermostaphylospora chromogena]|uniref:Uncharacterized protein n=1 Tax=Thermostaphylospora chromogena TaxID=35622 RepID=A0A1H1AAQ1_9ACTN|nr:hypothetical protein [Thermostaphylospora chromogena]SDQ36621.1 hypothetical protein SAMN04489764_0401 [Thermostaphylospora chromogena]
MGYVLNLQGTARSADADGNGALSISTNSWFYCQSSASQILCITAVNA